MSLLVSERRSWIRVRVPRRPLRNVSFSYSLQNTQVAKIDEAPNQLKLCTTLYESTCSGTLTLSSSLEIDFTASGLKNIADLKHTQNDMS